MGTFETWEGAWKVGWQGLAAPVLAKLRCVCVGGSVHSHRRWDSLVGGNRGKLWLAWKASREVRLCAGALTRTDSVSHQWAVLKWSGLPTGEDNEIISELYLCFLVSWEQEGPLDRVEDIIQKKNRRVRAGGGSSQNPPLGVSRPYHGGENEKNKSSFKEHTPGWGAVRDGIDICKTQQSLARCRFSGNVSCPLSKTKATETARIHIPARNVKVGKNA